MSRKYSKTTADYLEWSDAMLLIRKLADDGDYKMSLFISIGCFTGLRISDILSLRWQQIVNVEEFSIIEKKTGKQRTIRISESLMKQITECYENINPTSLNSHILLSQKRSVFSIQRINVLLKGIKRKYKLKIKNFSSHSLRKTFGRQVYNVSSENSEMALVKLMEIFNHSSIAITKRYLGLRQEEIMEVYDSLTF